MTTITDVKQPNFLMMKRVWIAIALPIVIFYFFSMRGLVQLALIWVFASIMLLMFAYKSFELRNGMLAPGIILASTTGCGAMNLDLLQ